MAKSKSKSNGKLTEKEFVLQAIRKLNNPKYGKGIHTVFSGFNQAFKEYFDSDPVAATKGLTKKGVIETRLVRGGAMIYVAGESPGAGNEALSKILS